MNQITVKELCYLYDISYRKGLELAHGVGKRHGASWLVTADFVISDLAERELAVAEMRQRFLSLLINPDSVPTATAQKYNPNVSDRTAAMLRLREAGHTLKEIGKLYDVSRERVRQIIGNTGHILADNIKRTIEEFDITQSSETIARQTGLSVAQVADHRPRTWHLVKGTSPNANGIAMEKWVANLLQNMGYEVELMPFRSHYDILINQNLKADVKSASSIIPPSLKGRAKSPRYSFKLRKSIKREPIDFYILVTFDTRDVFIVPYDILPMPKKTLIFQWPSKRPKIGKYQKYHNRFDLIEEAVKNDNQ